VGKHGRQWRSRRRVLGTGRIEVIDAKLLASRLTLEVAVEKRETLQKHGVKMVVVFSGSQGTIR